MEAGDPEAAPSSAGARGSSGASLLNEQLFVGAALDGKGPASRQPGRTPAESMACTSSDCSSLKVVASLWADNQLLAADECTSHSDSASWHEWLVFPYSYAQLPATAVIAIAVFRLASVTPENDVNDAEIVAGTTFRLFGDRLTLRQGFQRLRLWNGVAGDASHWPPETPSDFPRPRDQLDKLSLARKRRERGTLAQLPWLDRLALAHIEALEADHIALKPPGLLHLLVTVPNFPFPVVASSLSSQTDRLRSAGSSAGASAGSVAADGSRAGGAVPISGPGGDHAAADAGDKGYGDMSGNFQSPGGAGGPEARPGVGGPGSAAAARGQLHAHLPGNALVRFYDPLAERRDLSDWSGNAPAVGTGSAEAQQQLAAAVAVSSHNDWVLASHMHPCQIKHTRIARAAQRHGVRQRERQRKPDGVAVRALRALVAAPPTVVLSFEQRELVWQYRQYLTRFAKALPKFLLSVDWDVDDERREALSLLKEWERPDPHSALGLLSSRFSHCPVEIRRYACLVLDERCTDAELTMYLPALVEALRFDHFSVTEADLSRAAGHDNASSNRKMPSQQTKRLRRPKKRRSRGKKRGSAGATGKAADKTDDGGAESASDDGNGTVAHHDDNDEDYNDDNDGNEEESTGSFESNSNNRSDGDNGSDSSHDKWNSSHSSGSGSDGEGDDLFGPNGSVFQLLLNRSMASFALANDVIWLVRVESESEALTIASRQKQPGDTKGKGKVKAEQQPGQQQPPPPTEQQDGRQNTGASGSSGSSTSNVFQALLDVLMRRLARGDALHRRWRRQFQRQADLVRLISQLALDVRSLKLSRPKKEEKLREMLSEGGKYGALRAFPSLPLPLDPSVRVTGIDPQSACVFKSNLMPLGLSLYTEESDSEDDDEFGESDTNPPKDSASVEGHHDSQEGANDVGTDASEEGANSESTRQHDINSNHHHSPGQPKVATSTRSRGSKRKQGKPYRVIFKTGDDLRQDQFIVSLISLCDSIFRSEQLDLVLTPYQVLPTSPTEGFVERVESHPLASTLKDFDNDLRSFMRYCTAKRKNPRLAVAKDKDSWKSSSIGYSVITYVLGVGDRHLDNLLITPDARLFHIDFGYILGRDPKPFPPPMKLVREMVEAMGGAQSPQYTQFKLQACEAYNILRAKGSAALLNLFSLMSHSHLPDIIVEKDRVLPKVEENLNLQMTAEEAELAFQSLINTSTSSLFPILLEVGHKWAQYWRA